jgi:regulator of protease activity HflC (stomatin/prohibitin superfamily)
MLTRTNSSPQPATSGGTRWDRFVERRLLNVVMSLMVFTLVAAVLFPHVVITVPTGHVGVLWKRLGGFGIYCWCIVPRGTVLDPRELREEGVHLIFPWDILYLYDLRLQTMTRTYNAISKDGVTLTATINTRFQLQHDSIAQLHKFIGPDFSDAVISPVIGSRTRAEIAKHNAEAVYSTERDKIQEEIRLAAERSLGEQLDRLVQPESTEQLRQEEEDNDHKAVLAIKKATKVAPSLHGAALILDTPVLGIELPPPVVAAINRKIEQYYVAQEYEFRVSREVLEARRKAIEATGIRDFQQTVSQGISDSYLRWRGIEATLQLAQSNNAKIVIIGNGKDGLPIMLGNFDSSTPPRTAPGPAPSPDFPIPTNRPSVPSEQQVAPVASPSDAKPSDKAAAAAPPPSPTDKPTPPADKPFPPVDKMKSFLRSLTEVPNVFRRSEATPEPNSERPTAPP